jgi:hypothetical protein
VLNRDETEYVYELDLRYLKHRELLALACRYQRKLPGKQGNIIIGT